MYQLANLLTRHGEANFANELPKANVKMVECEKLGMNRIVVGAVNSAAFIQPFFSASLKLGFDGFS